MTRRGQIEDRHILEGCNAHRYGQIYYSPDYAVVFDQKVKRAYTMGERNIPLVMDRLICQFVEGIACREIPVRVHTGRPATLEDAYRIAGTADRADQLASRQEEPMEIGPLPKPFPGPPCPPDPFESILKRLGKIGGDSILCH